MSLKNKIALITSLLFSFIFAISATNVYLLFADFRRDEFEAQLREKALSSIKLLVEVDQVDKNLLKTINQNTVYKLYDEKTLIFDQDFNLIYSSLDDTKIKWTIEDLKYLKQKKTFFRKDGDNEIYGFYYDSNAKDYYSLVSANDNFGKRKLEYLISILAFTYAIFTVLTWVITYTMINRLLQPLNSFHKKIKGITESNLNAKIDVKQNRDEIDLLAMEFNQMLDRINQSYKKQQEFTSNASHEMRTPIARIMAKLDNKIIEDKSQNQDIQFHQTLMDDITELSELTNSLLLLSKSDFQEKQNETYRIDEVIFDASEKVNKQYPDFKLELNIEEVDNLDIQGIKSLHIIAFSNLIKNAYLYSDDKQVKVDISSQNNELIVTISNNGQLISEDEQKKLFEPFMRGQNAKNKSGLGLGLRIVKRIFDQQNYTIDYSNLNGLNTFTIRFHTI